MGGGILAKVSICLFELFTVALYYYGLGFCRQIKLKAKNGTKSNSANFSTLKKFWNLKFKIRPHPLCLIIPNLPFLSLWFFFFYYYFWILLFLYWFWQLLWHYLFTNDYYYYGCFVLFFVLNKKLKRNSQMIYHSNY